MVVCFISGVIMELLSLSSRAEMGAAAVPCLISGVILGLPSLRLCGRVDMGQGRLCA